MTTNRSKASRLNKTVTGFRDLHVNTPERNKLIVIRKIIMISSIKKEVKKILHKTIDLGIGYFCEEQSRVLLEEAKTILDNDKQKQLAKDLDKILSNKDESTQASEQILRLIKYFVISPTQKSYIVKIEKELKQDEDLDYQIKEIEEEINEQKNNKLRVYELEKTGKVLGMSTKVVNRKKQIDNFENKLMRSNQKLNELYANNNKLRDKISQLRKQKNAMETIYNKLKKELDKKNENVENTIKYANEANKARVKAEKDLKNLKEEAQSKKEQFKQECFKLNNQIQHDIRFKQFIKSKQIEKEQLDKLEEQIKVNEKTIQAKKQSNQKIDHEYRKSIAKEQEIKKAFDNIKKEIGIGNVGPENEGKQLLNVFINLYEKNAIMNTFVEELTKEVEELQDKIITKRKQIQQMYLRGSADQCQKDKLNEDLKKKVQYQKRKKQILDDQYQKSVETLTIIKSYLEEIFQQINIDPEVIEKLKNCNINEDNLTQFLGELQKKGLQAISHYGKLVGEQLKGEKGNSWEIQKQIDELNNIVTLQNVNTMNNPGPAKTADYPSELIIKVKDEKIKQEDIQKPLSLQEFKKFAIESLEQFQKKGGCPRQQQRNNKYTVSHQNSLKVKKRNKQNVQAK